MKECCENKEEELRALRQSQGNVLRIVLTINVVMFFVEAGGGIVARSTALLADSLDMLGDAFVYAFSLYVLEKSIRWRANVAFAKGLIMALFGLGVLGQAVSKAISHTLPSAETMGIIGSAALVANLACAMLLLRFRNDDINMRSTWLCSRNDVIANAGVLLASAAVAVTGSWWPDPLVGAIIATLILSSAYSTLRESVAELRRK